jgi:pyruvate/2-oxoglutarate dehydrogenase complex dihydrolipoamide acyltransferase (E2) component
MDIGVQVGGMDGSLRPILVAFGVSIAIHVAALSLLGGEHHELKPASILVVTLPMEPAEPAVAVATAAVAPTAPAPAPPAQTHAPAKEAAPPSPAPDETPHPARQAPDEPVPRAKRRPGIAPELARELVNRRLRVEVWVGPDGRVSKVDLAGNELSAQALSQLSASLEQMRFAPARKDGEPVEATLRSRLCFDENGEIDGRDPECSALAAQVR